MIDFRSARASAKAGRATGRQRRRPRRAVVDPVISAKLAFALKKLAENGQLTGIRTIRMSARVDPGLVKAARTKTGLKTIPSSSTRLWP